jgi:prepilin signal peptidase PulO-like enzyme (type II secretory pathway)
MFPYAFTSLDATIGIGVFFFGLIIGSFLNVIILRYGSGKSSVNARSQCLSCGESLSWKELVPVLSFVVQRGRCRHCYARISRQYPIVEIATGGFFAYVYYLLMPYLAWGTPIFVWSLADLILLWGIVGALIVLVVYDMRHMIIPDIVVYTFTILSALYAVLPALYMGWEVLSVWDLLAGPICAMLFAAMWFFSKGTWMGLGDAKLVLGMGFLLGFSGTVSALLFAFWSGALWGITAIGYTALAQKIRLLERTKKGTITMKSEVPFGPFLVAGLVAVLLFGFDILSLLS